MKTNHNHDPLLAIAKISRTVANKAESHLRLWSIMVAVFATVLNGEAQCFIPIGGVQNATAQPTIVATSSDALVVVGWYYPDNSGQPHAFRWAVGDSTLTDLGTVVGGLSSIPAAVSADGSVVVGQSVTPTSVRAFRWTASDHQMIDLGALGGGSSQATAVSADGQIVVGSSTTADNSSHVFRWRAGSIGMEDMQTLPGASYSLATGLSADGSVVVGYGNTAAGQTHGLVWTRGASSPTDLQTLPGQSFSLATAVSADGSAVLGLADFVQHPGGGGQDAIRWKIGSSGPGSPEDLQMLIVTNASTPTLISADGNVVVGFVLGVGGARWTAASDAATVIGNFPTAVSADGSVVVGGSVFRWSAADQTMKMLQTDFGLSIPPGWTLYQPLGISADGQVIVGTGDASGAPQVWLASLKPVIQNLAPSSALAGSGNFLLTINGSCFPNDATIFWNGVQKSTAFVNNSQLAAIISSSDLTLGNNQNITTVQVTVQNSAGIIGSRPFTIYNSSIGAVQSQTALPGQTVAVTAPVGGVPGISAVVNDPAANAPITVSAATYASTPSVGTIFDTGTTFLDLQVSGASASSSITVTFYSSSSPPVLRYWTGTAWQAVLSSGGVAPTWNSLNQPSNTVSFATVIFDSTSAPKITELTGTIFALPVLYKPAGSACVVNGTPTPGHVVLQPINADGSSVFKQGSTVPVKFAVFDANCRSVGTPGVVTGLSLVQVLKGTDVNNVNEAAVSTTADNTFRWNPAAQQWVFNLSTKNQLKNYTYVYQINLNDGTTIPFQYGLK